MNRTFVAGLLATFAWITPEPTRADPPTFSVAPTSDDPEMIQLKTTLDGVKPLTQAEKGKLLGLASVNVDTSMIVTPLQPSGAGSTFVEMNGVQAMSARYNAVKFYPPSFTPGMLRLTFNAASNRRYLVDCIVNAPGPMTTLTFVSGTKLGETTGAAMGGHVTTLIPAGGAPVRPVGVVLRSAAGWVWRSCEITPVQ